MANRRWQSPIQQPFLRRALLIPGGACFYVGWTTLGVLNLLVKGVLLLIVLLFLAGAFFATPAVNAPPGASAAREALIGVIGFLALLTLEKLVAWVHSRRYVRDFIPVK